MSRVILVKSVVDDHSLSVDKYHESTNDIAFVKGHYYSEKAPLPALLTIPIYAILKAAGFSNANDHLIYAIGNLVTGSIPFTLIILITFLFLQKIKPSPVNIFLSTLPFFGSFIFIYSGTFFAHVLTSLLVLYSYILLRYKENFFYSGLLIGMAVLCEYPVIIIAFTWGVQILIRRKKSKDIFYFIGGGILFGVFLVCYNYHITGKPFDSLYSHLPGFPESNTNLGFQLPYPEAVLELLLGIYRGILFFSPVLVAFIIYVLKAKKENLKSILSDYLWLPSLIYFFVIASNFTWRGGWCYGPRYLSCIAVLFLFEGSVFIKKKNLPLTLFYVFSIVGVLFSFFAKSTLVYSLSSDIKNPMFELLIPEFFKGNFNRNNILSLCSDMNPEIANIVWLFLLGTGLFFFTVGKKRSTLH